MIHLILAIHPDTPAKRFKVSLKSKDLRSPVEVESEDDGFISKVEDAMRYLSGQDGKLCRPDSANLADWYIVIAKLVKGDQRLLSGKLPDSEFSDPMTRINEMYN